MAEILTESFCERCGTRYTFESTRPKVRLKGVKVLSRGLKNFVLSDDTTMDEAMAAARSETDREVTAHQLDAFHTTFNFCMSCRQYTCPNCWNEVEARCLSCAPQPETEIMPAPYPGLATLVGTTLLETAVDAEPSTIGGNGHMHDELDIEAATTVEPGMVATEPLVGVLAEEPGQATQPEQIATVEPPILDPAEKAATQTAGLLRRFRPGQSLDDELAAYELQRIDLEPQDAEPVAAEPIVVAEPEPVRAAKPEPEPEAPAQAADVVGQPIWQITAPDAEGSPVHPPTRTDATIPLQAKGSQTRSAEPQWPAQPEWPAAQASVGLPSLGRPAQPRGGVDALWAASTRELVATPPTPGRSSSGIRPCVSCGLSLSATARFCRRCGTTQGD